MRGLIVFASLALLLTLLAWVVGVVHQVCAL